MTPLDRLIAANVLAPAQATELGVYGDSLNPEAIARQIADLQAVLLKLAKDKTEQLYLTQFPTARPDVSKARHPDQSLLTDRFRGHSYLRHGQHFAGNLT